MHRSSLSLIPAIVLTGLSLAGCSQNRAQSPAETTVPNQLPTVVETTGPNTVVVRDREQEVAVMLACVTVPPQTSAATGPLTALLPSGQAVQMRVVSPDQADPVRAELFLGNRPVGLQLVEQGDAMVDPTILTDCPETASRYWQAQIEAQQERRGVWGQYDLRVGTPVDVAPNLTLPVQATAGNCPPSVDLWAFRWGFEGGADHTVRVNLREIAAQPPSLLQSSDTSVVFTAPLQPGYAKCVGSARSEQMTMYAVDFREGRVQFSLNLQGDGTRKVLYQSVSANRPYIYWQATE